MFKLCSIIVTIIVTLAACSQSPSALVDKNKRVISAQASKLIDKEQLLSDFKYISSDGFEGRKYGSEGSKRTQQFIANQLALAHVKPLADSYYHQFEYQRGLSTYSGTNMIGYKQGKSEKLIVLTAHFDHLGKKAGKIYNGADDNASGTIAVLHIAKALQTIETNHSFIYLFTDAEEENLVGAYAFAQDFGDEMTQTILNVNLDMLAGAKYTKRLYYLPYKVDNLGVAGWQSQLQHYANLHELSIRKGPRAYHNFKGQKKKTNWRKASDHGVFYRNKIPFLYFGVGVHNNYHTEQDTFENTNHSFYTSTVKTIFDQLYNLDQQIQ